MDFTPPHQAVPDDRGSFIVIGGSPYLAYAIHGYSAYLTRATRNPDGSVTLHPVGSPHARLYLAADTGHWHADREAHAATAEHECSGCGTPLTLIDSVWVSMDYTTAAGGLSFCPPDPDASHTHPHLPRQRTADGDGPNVEPSVRRPEHRGDDEPGAPGSEEPA